jgi:hypothetical protein
MDDTPPPQTVDRKRIAKEFRAEVKTLVEDENDRQLLFEVLKDYQTTQAIDALVKSLRNILCTPKRLQLFKVIRGLLPAKHQKLFDDLCPVVPSGGIRTIRLWRHGKEPLGFTIRGGREHNTAVYISSVTPNSNAARAKLNVGDRVIRINGYNISELTHNEVVQFIKMRNMISIRLKSEGMLPEKKSADQPITWTVVEKENVQETNGTKPNCEKMQDPTSMDKGERRIVIHNTEKSPLGCTVRGGIEHGMGIFVADVNEDSMAEAVGLHNGDQIMSVNGVSFEKISHAEAIQVIKSSQSLILTIKSSRDVSLKGPMEPLETPISNPNVTFKAVKMPEKPEIALSPVTDTKPAAQIPTVFKAAPGLAPASVFVADGLPDTTNFKLFEPDNTSSFRMFDRKARDSIYSLVTTDDDTKQPIHQTPDITKPSQSTDMVTERPVSIPQTDTTKTEEINEVTPPEPPPLPTEEQLTTTEDETPSSTRGRRTETKQSSLFDVTYDSHLGMCTIPVTVTSHSKQEETGHQVTALLAMQPSIVVLFNIVL